MATKNPECSNGWVEPDPDRKELYVACCGCGWRQPGVTSKTRAKNAQRRHRFPRPQQEHAVVFSHPPATEGPRYD